MKFLLGLVVLSLILTVPMASPFGCTGGENDLTEYSDGSLKNTSVLAYDFRRTIGRLTENKANCVFNCMDYLKLTIDQIRITTPGLVMNCQEGGSGFDHFQFSVNRGNPFYLDIKIWVTWTKDVSVLRLGHIKCDYGQKVKCTK